MAITGNSADLSLIDLIQANVLVRNVCRITVAGAAGSGAIFLAEGTVVHAAYGGLEGRDAFFALVGGGDVFFQVETGVRAPRRTIQEKWENLALEAMRLKDEGKLPPVRLAAQVGAHPAAAPAVPPAPLPQRQVAPQPVPFPARPKPAPQRAPKRSPLPLVVGVAALVILGGVGAYVALGTKGNPSTDEAQASPAVAPLEASELTGPGDRQPVLRQGTPPASPAPELAVRPTIVCRILVNREGRVEEARVYQSRLDLAPFETAALEAVRGYRFSPALKNGTPVPVWVNWPVSFQ